MYMDIKKPVRFSMPRCLPQNQRQIDMNIRFGHDAADPDAGLHGEIATAGGADQMLTDGILEKE
jgi:hypothetical protein